MGSLFVIFLINWIISDKRKKIIVRVKLKIFFSFVLIMLGRWGLLYGNFKEFPLKAWHFWEDISQSCWGRSLKFSESSIRIIVFLGWEISNVHWLIPILICAVSAGVMRFCIERSWKFFCWEGYNYKKALISWSILKFGFFWLGSFVRSSSI